MCCRPVRGQPSQAVGPGCADRLPQACEPARRGRRAAGGRHGVSEQGRESHPCLRPIRGHGRLPQPRPPALPVPHPLPQTEGLTTAADTQGPSGHGPGHPPSSPGSTVLRMARTRPRGEPKRKKSDTSKSRRPRLTSGGWDALGAGASASSFSTLEWMLSREGREPGGPLGTARAEREELGPPCRHWLRTGRHGPPACSLRARWEALGATGPPPRGLRGRGRRAARSDSQTNAHGHPLTALYFPSRAENLGAPSTPHMGSPTPGCRLCGEPRPAHTAPEGISPASPAVSRHRCGQLSPPSPAA